MQRNTPVPQGAPPEIFDAAAAAREQFEIIDQLWDSVRRKQRITVALAVLVAIASGATIWYVRSALRRQDAAISAAAINRGSSVDALPSSTAASPAPSKDAGSGAGTKQIAALTDKLARVESAQQAGESRIAVLEQTIDKLAKQRPEAPNAIATSARGATDNGSLDRIDFEVARGHSRQIASGISLGVSRIDLVNLGVDGWLWIMPDRRTIWLHGRGAQQQVVFYGHNDGKRRELVISQVGKDSIAGYLLVPKNTARGFAVN